MKDTTLNIFKKPLVVYKASAGSGKTFTLAIEFIKLLICNPQKYRNILAVTFTNKATEEMKMRILSQLYGISKRLPDSKDYMDKITSELDMSEPVVSERAGVALSYLIHNYNYFRVETIDAFFQSVLRNLARELDLTANLRIELNDKQVEQLAVEQLIESLDDKSLMLYWLREYVSDNISEDKSWNVIAQIKKFGENIFKDVYKEKRQEMDELFKHPDFFADFAKRLREMKKDTAERMKQIGETFFDTLSENGIDESLFPYGKTGICGYFFKLREGIFDDSLLTKRVLGGLEDTANWLKKSKDKELNAFVSSIVETTLYPLIKYAEEVRPDMWKKYQSAELTLRHINQLRLLKSIGDKVYELNREANRFLLSDTQNLLGELIDDNDSPFIFEKTGTQIEHVMIDEFQDTSTVQWRNFKVLLAECMSHDNAGNMIVGDVKQSIYRWRSGDWRLLNNISSEFADPEEQIEEKPLSTNYRSERNIIEFNNAFFTLASQKEYEMQAELNEKEAEQMRKAYSDVVQEIPKGRLKQGYVRIELLPKEEYRSSVLERIKSIIKELKAQGTANNRIAILIRYNRDIPIIADYFMREIPEVKVVSDEAFRLDASLAVNTIVQALRVLSHPDDIMAKAELVKAYNKINNKESGDTELFVVDEDIDKEKDNYKTKLSLKLNNELPDIFLKERAKLLSMPLMDLVDSIFSMFGLNNLHEQSAYVCTFYDKLNDYLQDNTSDIDTFINEWNEKMHSKTIQSDSIDGIRLISIHKSKGLEFENVILPFCDWEVEKLGDTIWCQTDEKPFSELPIIPVDYYPNQMRGTVYEKDYLFESVQKSVDNLNLLYVAFTRAGKSLYVIGKRNAKRTRSNVIQECIDELADKLPNAVVSGKESDEESIVFEYGMLANDAKKEKKYTENVFLQEVKNEILDIETYKRKVAFRQSNDSRMFVSEDEESISSRKKYIKKGNVLHHIFSTIHSVDDIPRTLKRMETDGILYNEEVTRDEVRQMLENGLANPVVRSWFSSDMRVLNECSILSVDKKTKVANEHRPDRVMINGNNVVVVDFKFGNPHEEHHEQVRTYMDLLYSMGYVDICGYLWYVKQNQVVKIEYSNERA